MVLDASLLNTQHYKVWIKGKVEQSWEGLAPSPTPWCSSYRKGSLQITLDKGRQLLLYFALSDNEVLNSLEELCITRVTTINSFTNPPPVGERIYCQPQTDCFVVSNFISIPILQICETPHTHTYTHTHTHTHIYIYIYMARCNRFKTWLHISNWNSVNDKASRYCHLGR